LDEALGQDAREISAGVVRLVAEFGAHLSFGTSAALLEKAQPAITLSARQVETIAEAVGEQAACLQQAAVAAAAQQPLATTPHPHLRLVGAPPPPPQTWIIEMDGVHAPLRDGTWQEVKCGLIYRHDQRLEISRERGVLLHKLRCGGARRRGRVPPATVGATDRGGRARQRSTRRPGRRAQRGLTKPWRNSFPKRAAFWTSSTSPNTCGQSRTRASVKGRQPRNTG
jgi:hypothetical protein